MTEFKCEGCGVEVVAFYTQSVPEHGFCLTCELIDKSHRHDLKEFWAIYERITPVAERAQKKPASQPDRGNEAGEGGSSC